MERFAALVTGHRASPVPAPAPATTAKGKGKKGKVVEEGAAYLSIQLEEIVIVKNDDSGGTAARGLSALVGCGASTSMTMRRQRVEAAAAPPSGMSAASAASSTRGRGALSTTVGWIVGSDVVKRGSSQSTDVGRVSELRSRVYA